MNADELRAPDTDDEPWDVPGPDEHSRRRWLVFAALAVAIVLLGLVRVR
jgi:hypothetical protein